MAKSMKDACFEIIKSYSGRYDINLLNHPVRRSSWKAMISTFKSDTASARARMVESLAWGKNSQFHVIISMESFLFKLGKSQSFLFKDWGD